MPPCSWMHSSATRVPMRPMVTLAADSARSRVDAIGVERGGGVDHRRAGLLDLQQQVGHAVLQRLEAADRHAELLAGAQVVERRILGHVHRADGFGAQRQHALADAVLDRRAGLALGTDQCIGAERHAGQREFRSAAAVDVRIAAQRHAGGAGRHQEQRDAGRFVERTRRAGRHHEEVCLLGVLDHRLDAVEPPLPVDALGARLHMVERMVSLGLAVCERRDLRAADDLGEQRLLLRAAGVGDGAAGKHGAEEGLDHQSAAECLEHHRDVEAAAGEAAVVLAEQRADHAEVGELAPQVGAAALGRAGDAVARLECILLGDEAVQAVGQHAAVIGVLEVHAVFLFTARGSSWR